MIAVLSRRRPELWTIAAAVVAWLMIVSAMLSTIGADHHHASTMAEPYARQFAIDWLRWSLMVLAMMLPLTIDAVRATAIRSLWRRRDRAVAVWLCGYLAPWLLLGAVCRSAGGSMEQSA